MNARVEKLVRKVVEDHPVSMPIDWPGLVTLAECVLEYAAEIAEHEAALYSSNADLCEKSHGHFSATNDIQGELACKRIAGEIRKVIGSGTRRKKVCHGGTPAGAE